MFRFIVMCERDDVALRSVVRLIEHDRRTGEFAYSISEQMLRSGFGNRDWEYLVREIARQFVGVFNQRRTDKQFVRA